MLEQPSVGATGSEGMQSSAGGLQWRCVELLMQLQASSASTTQQPAPQPELAWGSPLPPYWKGECLCPLNSGPTRLPAPEQIW